MLRHRFSHDIVYKALLKLDTLYYVYTYLKDTYQLEDEAQEIYDEIVRQSKQIIEIAKENDVHSTKISDYIGDISIHVHINFHNKFLELDNIVINNLKSYSEYIFIDKNNIIKIIEDNKRCYSFFEEIDLLMN